MACIKAGLLCTLIAVVPTAKVSAQNPTVSDPIRSLDAEGPQRLGLRGSSGDALVRNYGKRVRVLIVE